MAVESNAGRIGIWGRSGSGKSTYAKRLIKGRKRIVVFDPLSEYGGAGFKVVHTVDAVRRAMRADWRGFRIAIVPSAGSEPRTLSSLCKLLMAAQQPYKETGKGAGVTLVVEEMSLSFPVSGGAQKAPGFAQVCSMGRHYGIEVIGISQRIAEVATRFRGNCTETVVLRQKGPRDLDAAAAELGVGRAQVEALGRLEYLHEKDGKITPGKLKFH